jgi:hypothetical protein
MFFFVTDQTPRHCVVEYFKDHNIGSWKILLFKIAVNIFCFQNATRGAVNFNSAGVVAQTAWWFGNIKTEAVCGRIEPSQTFFESTRHTKNGKHFILS